jgi:CheY-like chemotaxis protein
VRVRREVVQVPRILVADDNTNIQKMVVLAFEERGVDVVAVGNGEAAVRRIPDANPDLVLADVFMPVRNGYEVCEFVKKDTRFAHVPVILLVGAFDPLDEKEARRVGADGVLKKPFVPPDPLIAMVMSALEKNPKVAAELAKARETPPEPPPPPVMEIAAKAEPKPLPDFPEPTPEEAAAIYGFGKGVRSLDDEPETETEERKAPKAPVAKAKDADEDEDEDDGAATATDWRRTGGMDFEIPENTAVDPAYSYGKDLAPITFPSEKEVPPKRIHVRDDELDNEPVAPLGPIGQQLASKPVESSPAVEEEEAQSFAPYGMRLSAESSASEQAAPSAWHESAAFKSAVNNPATLAEETSAPAVTAKKDEAPAVVEMKQPAFAPVVTKVPQSSTPWTDLTAPPSEYPEGSWMTDSSSSPAAHVSESKPSVKPEPAREPEPVASAPAWRMEPAIAQPTTSSESSWRSPLESRPETEHHAEGEAREEAKPRKKSWFADAIEAVREVVHGNPPTAAQPEQPISTSHVDAASEPVSELAPEPVVSTSLVAPVREELPEEFHQESSVRETGEAESTEASSAFSERPSFERKPDAEIVNTPAASAPSHKDPALEMPPAARVTPEPLLVRDEPAPSSYEDREEYAAPLQSFPFPGESEPTNGEPAADLVATPRQEEAPIFAAASEASVADESAHTDFSERIPTVPPPNREALAGIPFLIPSPAVLEQVNSPQAPAPQANLDEVVQRVLERLEPQLHELLSKNLLKPLVENMLQAELAKKDNR